MTYIDIYGVFGLLAAIAFGYLSDSRYRNNERRMDGLFLFYVAAASYAMCIWLFTREAGKYPSLEAISTEQWDHVKRYIIARSAIPAALLLISWAISGHKRAVSLFVLLIILLFVGVDMYYVTEVFPRYSALLHNQ